MRRGLCALRLPACGRFRCEQRGTAPCRAPPGLRLQRVGPTGVPCPGVRSVAPTTTEICTNRCCQTDRRPGYASRLGGARSRSDWRQQEDGRVAPCLAAGQNASTVGLASRPAGFFLRLGGLQAEHPLRLLCRNANRAPDPNRADLATPNGSIKRIARDTHRASERPNFDGEPVSKGNPHSIIHRGTPF